MHTSDSLESIHKDLADEVSWGLKSLRDTWAKDGHIGPFMLVWPYETVMFEGQRVNDAIPIMLPEDPKGRESFMRSAAKKTKAWALMLCEQRDQAVVVIFESPLGTRSWHLPIARHGDTLVLESPKERVDVDYLNIQYRAGATSAR